jgi:hypothetical protein
MVTMPVRFSVRCSSPLALIGSHTVPAARTDLAPTALAAFAPGPKLASVPGPGTAVPRGVRRAPWAAVAARTRRRAEVAQELAARMQADVG